MLIGLLGCCNNLIKCQAKVLCVLNFDSFHLLIDSDLTWCSLLSLDDLILFDCMLMKKELNVVGRVSI